MKSKEELNELKKEVASVNEKLQELTEEEIEKVCGGANNAVVGAHLIGVGGARLKMQD